MPFLLLEATNITQYYSDRKILAFKTFRIYSGDRIGVIGANGSGKTTLLNILSGELAPDIGFIKHYCDLSFIHQFGSSEVKAGAKEQKEFGIANKTDAAKMSGGEQTRLKIAEAFSSRNPLVFADEPTSNLDLSGIELFCQKLNQVESFVLISHDRNVLDRLCNKMIEVKDGTLHVYEGGFQFYKEQSELEEQQRWFAYRQYSNEKQREDQAGSEARGITQELQQIAVRDGHDRKDFSHVRPTISR